MPVRQYIFELMTDSCQSLMDVLVQCLLWALSIPYAMVLAVRRSLYQAHILPQYRSPKPVISVGNITLGGTGKTPLVMAIVEILQAKGIRPVVLTRGYMTAGALFSDEAMVLKEQLKDVPVLSGANRKKNIEDCLKHHAVDVFICDDAFAHLGLARDLEVMVIDTTNPFGNSHVVPRGILREGIAALKGADFFVLTKVDLPASQSASVSQRLTLLNPKALMAHAVHKAHSCVDVLTRKAADLKSFQGLSVIAFCAIADPTNFKHSLMAAGFLVKDVMVFMDHHVFTLEDIARVRRLASDSQVQMILTTHKDAVKLSGFNESWQGFKVYYLQVVLDIVKGKNVFIDRLLSVVPHQSNSHRR